MTNCNFVLLLNWEAIGDVRGRCKSYYFVLTLVRENHILVREKSGNF